MPLPLMTSEPLPLMTPANVVGEALVTVRVCDSRLTLLPATPASEATVWLVVPRSSVAPLPVRFTELAAGRILVLTNDVPLVSHFALR